MDRYVVDPHWHDFIIWYFFLGGVAAGAFAVARLIDLFGDEYDRRAALVADWIAFPLVCLCGLLLVIDLGRPERFWHMLIQSNTFRPMFKWWSPMSAGSWGLSAFGAFASASFLGALADEGRFGLGRWKGLLAWRNRGVIGKLYALGGLASAFFLGSYTGALLNASNQPIWSDSTWISPLFLASSVSTGLAAMALLVRWRRPEAEAPLARLERADSWAIGLEAAMLVALAVSLGRLAVPAFNQWPGALVPAFVVPVGLLGPLLLKRFAGHRGAWVAAAMVLIGGFALRAAIVGIAGPLLIYP